MQDHSLDPRGFVGEPWVDKFGRVRHSHVTYIGDDGHVSYGREAAQAAMRHWRSTVAPPKPSRVPPRVRRPKARARERRPGQTRRSAASSRSASADPPGPGDDPPLPPAVRADVQRILDGVAARILRETGQ